VRDNLSQDLRHGWRGLCQAPAFSLVVLTFALGMAGTTAMFALGILLRPLAIPDEAQLPGSGLFPVVAGSRPAVPEPLDQEAQVTGSGPRGRAA
jgi:hypothetical protein